MTATKISLQDVVGTICDALAELAPEDQTRALEAVRLTLGLGETAPSVSWGVPIRRQEVPAALTLPSSSPPAQEALVELEDTSLCEALVQEKPVKRLPTVLVQMMGDRPMVVGQQMGRSPVVASPPRTPHRATPAQAATRGGYVLRRR